MKTKIGDTAFVETIGAILLLAMAVAAFSVIYLNVLSDDGPGSNSYATVIGKMETGYPVFEHQRGEGINVDSKVMINRGKNIYVTNVNKILDSSTSNGDNIWDVGERLIYPHILTDWYVGAKIVDSKSNSLIFWGTLQEGFRGDQGGIWHFNESSWSGTSYDVEDSSGNNNHGIARNGADTIDDVVSPLANRSGIFNVNDYNDYVEVPDDVSLDITEEITVEAWFKPFTDSFGTVGLLDQFGYTPYVTNITSNNNILAVVSEDQSQDALIQTIDLIPHQQLSEDSIIDISYSLGEGHTPLVIRPIITHVNSDIYVVAYNNKSESKTLGIYLKTFNISSNGSIEYTGNKIFDDNESDIGEPNRPSIVKVCDFETYSIIAIAYGINVDGNHPSVGVIRTVNISYDGKIKFTGKMANFEDVEGYGPSIIHVAGDVFAIAYRNSSNTGLLKTFNISSNGSISYTGKEFIFDDKTHDKDLNPPSIVKVSDFETYSVFAIVYGVYTDHSIPAAGIVKTVKIYYFNGTIITTGFNKKFEVSSCYNPYIMHHSENYYVIVFDTEPWANSKGKYITLQIAENGNIISIESTVTFDEDRSHNPIAIKISERGFAIVYESIAGGSGHPGYLKPIQLEYSSDIYSKGIHKKGSYGIYVNPTNAFVNINNKTINASIAANSWNHVVLTYDQQYMKLYVNGILKNSKTMTEAINQTYSKLIFGDLFYGLIDEVGIYDRAFSYDEVQDHFKLFAPIIVYNINASEIDYTSAKITWDSNVPGSSIVRYGTTTPLTNEVSNPSLVISHSLTLTSLLSKTTYYYEVESSDEYGNKIIDNNGGMYYTFTTENRAPNVPRLPNPDDGDNNVKTNIDLSWVGGDEDGDDVTYDVYLNMTGTPITKVSNNQSFDFYDSDPDFMPNTTYYWQIIAWDSIGASSDGPIWSFTTRKN